MEPIRERKHRLNEAAYRGKVCVSYTVCVESRPAVLTTGSVARTLIDILVEAARHQRCIAPVYCLMPDHLHVVLTGQEDDSCSLHTMYRFKQRSGFWLKQNLKGVAWQKDFHDHVIRSYEDFRAHLWYVFCNPVRGGLVVDPFDYPYSGAIDCDLRANVLEL